jgi:RNA polymerase sigma-70 factor (ECF subfamily)
MSDIRMLNLTGDDAEPNRFDDLPDADIGDPKEAFVAMLVAAQSRLFGYILTLLGDVEDARNVLQQTNLTLWRNSSTFTPGTSFQAWSRRIAYYKVLGFLRDKERDRHVFDEELLQQLSARASEIDEDEQRVALRHCLSRLSDDHLDLIRQRYLPGKSIRDIAELRSKSESAIKVALLRIRQALARCIEDQLQPNHDC